MVTAQKRTEDVRDVAASINAFSGDRLIESGIKNIEDLQFLSAGLEFGHDRSGNLSTSIRGISSNIGTESGVAMHLDGVYLANNLDRTGAFFDVARLEVLRGPQGTLYGRNATGGAINIITKDPTADTEIGGRVTFGNYDLIETEGFLSGPIISDKVLARFSFKTSNLPGYGIDIYNGERINGADSVSLRGKLIADVTSDITVRLSVDYYRSISSDDDQVARVNPAIPLGPEARGYFEPTGFNSNANPPDRQDTRTLGASARIDWDLGFASLSSLTGYRTMDRGDRIDIDGTNENCCYFKKDNSHNIEVTEELNLTSAGTGPFQWIAGIYFYSNHYTADRDVPIPNIALAFPPGTPPAVIALNSEIFAGVNGYNTNAYAFFGEASYQLLDNLKLTVGGRYSHESSSDDEFKQPPVGYHQCPAAPCTVIVPPINSSAFTPKATLQYNFAEDIMAYATYSQGFKSGGYNVGNNDPISFKPEKVKNYEIGAKATLFGGMLQANLALFDMEYTDLQVRTVVITSSGTPSGRVVNADSARIRGAELDFFGAPLDYLTVDGNMSFLDTDYTKFPQAADPVLPAAVSVLGATGNQLVQAPRFTSNLGANLSFPVYSWSGIFRVEWSHSSTVYYTPFNTHPPALPAPYAALFPFALRNDWQNPYDIINLRLSFTNKDQDWDVALWGKNLNDALVISSLGEATDTPVFTGSFTTRTFRPPRTFGITISKNF
ncbi:MAG: TonB-dependent receptor [Alphaproteobacteria bacterium]|nr:TonB-dependent receptor [Alphaproteobacteria bacterium]